ncbi:hypothetical protein [Brachyspira hyodysenteriae]|uniref:hypothetical protein n=1 Tax=Brachyspira hyodysenteriae TaxID=159 RepID=UPI0022CD9A79|nr:hypothetical protein [Brachyspira hyodysenteriae]MCZ9966658.1 hypothetical protein [Brachyspira hyodysenteriae]
MKIFILFAVLILAVSCAKDNPLNSSNNNNNQTIANYEGTYEGKAKYTRIPYPVQDPEENVSLIVNKDSTVTFKTTSKEFPFNSVSKEFHFNSVSKEDDKNYNSIKTENGSTLIFSLIFDGNGNVKFSLVIQDNNTGRSEIYSSDKLTKTAS